MMTRIVLMALGLILVLPAPAQRLRVAFVGDPQVDNETELTYARRSVYQELRKRQDVDLAIFLGDLVNDNPSLLPATRAILDSLPYNWACVPGNHDRDVYTPSVKGKPRDMASYSRIIHTPDTAFVQGGVQFIMMDDVLLTGGSAGYWGGFRDDQKQWLRKVLDLTPQDRLAVLCAHIPFNEFKSLDSLETILSVHPKLLLVCGHTHTMARHTLRFPGGLEVEEVLAGAACGSWWRGRADLYGVPVATQNCGSPRSYYLADFSRGCSYRLDAKVIGASAEEKASAWIADTTRLLVNVYAGSMEGSVQVKLPGRCGWIALERVEEPAPEVYETQQFNKSLVGRQSRNPLFIPMLGRPSPHLWGVKLPAGSLTPGGQVKIRYKDASMRFTTTAALQVSPGPQSRRRLKK